MGTLFAPVVYGCGGGSGPTGVSKGGPIVSPQVPAGGVANLQTFTVANATPPQTGSTVTVRVEINNSANLNTTTNPPRIDVRGPGNTSLINGPQPLQRVSGDANGWTYQYNITSGTPAQQYTFVVYAQDTSGNTGNTPYVLGTVTLP